MKGILKVKEHVGWVVEWPNTHSFGFGKELTPLHPDDISNDLRDGQEVEIDIKYDVNQGFRAVARLKKFDHQQVEAHTLEELEMKFLDLLVEQRNAHRSGDTAREQELEEQIKNIETQIELRERLFK